MKESPDDPASSWTPQEASENPDEEIEWFEEYFELPTLSHYHRDETFILPIPIRKAPNWIVDILSGQRTGTKDEVTNATCDCPRCDHLCIIGVRAAEYFERLSRWWNGEGRRLTVTVEGIGMYDDPEDGLIAGPVYKRFESTHGAVFFELQNPVMIRYAEGIVFEFGELPNDETEMRAMLMVCFASWLFEEALAKLELRGAKRLPPVQEVLQRKSEERFRNTAPASTSSLNPSTDEELRRVAAKIIAKQARDGKGRSLKQIIKHVRSWLSVQRKGVLQEVYCGYKSLEMVGETIGAASLRKYMTDLVSYGLLDESRTVLDEAKAERLIELIEGEDNSDGVAAE
jgi:hypothetical protein